MPLVVIGSEGPNNFLRIWDIHQKYPLALSIKPEVTSLGVIKNSIIINTKEGLYCMDLRKHDMTFLR